MEPVTLAAAGGILLALIVLLAVFARLRRSRLEISALQEEKAALEAERDGATAELEALRNAPPPQLDSPFPVCRFSQEGRFLSANETFVARFADGKTEGIEANKVVLRMRLMVSKHLENVREAKPGDLVTAGTLPLPASSADSACQVLLSAIGSPGSGDSQEIDAVLVPATESWMAPALEYAPVGVVFLGNNERMVAGNGAFRNFTGAGANGAGFRGRSFADFVDDEDRETAQRFLEECSTSSPAENIEVRLVGKAGEEGAEVAVFCQCLEAGEGPEGAHCALYLIDIGRRRQLEAQVAQSQKMQAVGQLAGGVAHDFNNLLTAMNGYCDLLLARHRPGDQSFSDVMQVKQNANRAANLVRQLLAFSRQQTMIARVLDVTETLADLSHLLRRLIGENITLEISHGRELAPIRVDQGQLEQVVINLVVNARDACPSGGTITMKTFDFVTEMPVRQGDDMMPSGRYVRLDVSDTGSGIEDEIIGRIFEPFFSTKEVGQGTGLGLSTVYGIVKQINGFISVYSTVGVGTTFSIFLPAYEGEVSRSEGGDPNFDAANARKDLTGVETIMLVEDEDPVRLFGARALRNKGYKVIEARNGEAALQLLSDKSEEIDLLITDVVMPGMDGPTLVRKVREDRPDLRVICISGYSEDALRQRIEEDTNIHFLPKPFSLKQLAGTVKDVLHPLQ
ncbi:response regulator [Nisaea acidiphila]|uniref:histidine kinase n=1 Tax=Nisaea acidiphila TaxID=1862145 RepID=A0A9J7AVH3_9PROT|nr:ATP-binding protein [Nisaea acidiphila]UUX50465.1 response regulator [Nisaea acidiphila]